MKSMIKSAVPGHSIGLWILVVLFALNVCVSVKTASVTSTGDEVVLAFAK